jgi:hypothetical protein
MNKVIYLFLILFSINVFSAPTSLDDFCPSGHKGWNNDSCISSCSGLTVDGTYNFSRSLSDGAVGFCYGQATVYKEWVYKLTLGVSSDTTEKCTIFDGTLVIDSGTANPGQEISSGELDFSACRDGITYDVLYITSNQIKEYAGETTYPDSSGSTAKTANYCATDSDTSMDTDLAWVDVMSGGSYSDSTLCYIRQSTTWNTASIKAAASPTTTDYSSSSASTIQWDEWKSTFLNSLSNSGGAFDDPTTAQIDSEGYYKEYDSDTGNFSSSVGATYANGDRQSGKIITKLTTSSGALDIFGGQPFDKNVEHSAEISIYAKNRNSGDSNEYGLRFYFLRDGTTAKFVGTNPTNTGLYITISASASKVPFE